MDLVILCLYYPYKATRQWMVKWRNQFWFTRSCGILNSNANKLSRDKELENTKKMVHTDLLALYFNIQDSHWNKAHLFIYLPHVLTIVIFYITLRTLLILWIIFLIYENWMHFSLRVSDSNVNNDWYYEFWNPKCSSSPKHITIQILYSDRQLKKMEATKLDVVNT